MRPKTSSASSQKDKSTKRKSNLNRALTEEVVSVVTEASGEIRPHLPESASKILFIVLIYVLIRQFLVGLADENGKRIRRRRAETSSAETDLNSGIDASAASGFHSPSCVLRSSREAVDVFRQRTSAVEADRSKHDDETSSSWKNQQSSVASAAAGGSGASAIAPEELTARIEALTAMANQTVARVDRLTAVSGSTSGSAAASPETESKARRVFLLILVNSY